MQTCVTEGCGKATSNPKRGMCSACYQRHLTAKHRDDTGDCTVADCRRKAAVGRNGLCGRHYTEAYRAGKTATCVHCDGKVFARNLCSMHYNRAKRGIPMDKIPNRKHNGAKCSVDGCQRGAKSKGLCRPHYTRQRDGISLDAPMVDLRRKAPRPDGYVNGFGYRAIRRENRGRLPNGRRSSTFVLEHRAIMAKHLGRALTKAENVHHKNGNRLDNRLENLELWVKRQPNGQRVVDLIAYAQEILATYGTDTTKYET